MVADGAMSDNARMSVDAGEMVTDTERQLMEKLHQLQLGGSEAGQLLDASLELLLDAGDRPPMSESAIELTVTVLLTVEAAEAEKCARLAGAVFRTNVVALVGCLSRQAPYHVADTEIAGGRLVLLFNAALESLLESRSEPHRLDAFNRCFAKNLLALLLRCRRDPLALGQLFDLAHKLDLSALSPADSAQCCLATIEALAEFGHQPAAGQQSTAFLASCSRLLNSLWHRPAGQSALEASLRRLFELLADTTTACPVLLALCLRGVRLQLVPQCCRLLAERYASSPSSWQAIADTLVATLSMPGPQLAESWTLYLVQHVLRLGHTVACLEYAKKCLPKVVMALGAFPHSRQSSLILLDFFALLGRQNALQSLQQLRPALASLAGDSGSRRQVAELCHILAFACQWSPTDDDDDELQQLLRSFPAPSEADMRLRLRAHTPKSLVQASSVDEQSAPVRADSGTGCCGLLNLGNTCFANAAIQLLLLAAQRCPQLPNALAELPNARACGQLAGLLRTLAEADATVANPRAWLQLSRPAYMRHGSQQDSAEYLLHSLDLLLEEEKAAAGAGCIRRCFGGHLRQVVQCSADSSHQLVSECPFVTLHLPLPASGQSSVSQLLEELQRPEPLGGDDRPLCERCGRKVDAEKRSQLAALPHCLLLVLQRFTFDAGSGLASKHSGFVQLQERLRLTAGVAAPTSSYTLQAFVLHHGLTLHSGHYTVVRRHPAQPADWVHISDDTSSFTSLSVWNQRPTVDFKTPYILLYVLDQQ